MDLTAYRSEGFGGLGGVIARRVRVNEDAPTRRRERRSTWADDAEALKVIEAFQRARLLAADRGVESDDPVIEVAHNADFWFMPSRFEFHFRKHQTDQT